MKRLVTIMLMACCIACSGCRNNNSMEKSEGNYNEDLNIINQFVSYSNSEDIEEYISLFSSEIQDEMRSFVDINGEENFFSGEQRELLYVSKVNNLYIEENAWQFDDVIAKYEDFYVYYIIENDTFGEETEVKHNGIQSNLYIIVIENNERMLYRISAAPEIGDQYLEEISVTSDFSF